MITTKKPEMTSVNLEQRENLTYERRTSLFGLVKWWVVVRAEKLGPDLVINTLEKYDRIIVNGEEVALKAKQ